MGLVGECQVWSRDVGFLQKPHDHIVLYGGTESRIMKLIRLTALPKEIISDMIGWGRQ